MRKLLLTFVVSSIFYSCGNSSTSTPETPPFKGTIVPVYFYNTTLWEKLATVDCNGCSFFAIVNPDNGPGNQTDPNYTRFIDELNTNGKIPIGYVYTKWASRNITDVEKDVDTWLELYPNIKGFFIDEVSDNEGNLTYYQQLVSYIKQKGNYTVVLNPGTLPVEGYFSLADYVVVYENSEGYLFQFLNASCLICTDGTPYAEKSACIVYGVNSTDWQKVAESLKGKCSLLYLTDGQPPNPYDHLPPYFEQFVSTFFK